jgi:hypothetical protein
VRANGPSAIAVVCGRDAPETDMCSGICDACYDVGADELMRCVVAYYRGRAKDDACIARRIDFPGRDHLSTKTPDQEENWSERWA